MSQWYRGTQADVQAYVDAINNHPLLPIVEENGYRMDKWCDDARECLDGLYACPKPEEKRLKHFGVTQEQIDAFRAAYVTDKLTEEPHDSAWFPQPIEE